MGLFLLGAAHLKGAWLALAVLSGPLHPQPRASQARNLRQLHDSILLLDPYGWGAAPLGGAYPPFPHPSRDNPRCYSNGPLRAAGRSSGHTGRSSPSWLGSRSAGRPGRGRGPAGCVLLKSRAQLQPLGATTTPLPVLSRIPPRGPQRGATRALGNVTISALPQTGTERGSLSGGGQQHCSPGWSIWFCTGF